MQSLSPIDILSRQQRLGFERSVMPLTCTLRRSALRLARSGADADDLVQETVLRAWRFWPRYDERASCRAWLQRILHNAFVSEMRRRRRERHVLALRELHDAQPGMFALQVEAEVAQGGLDDAMRLGLTRLREDQRRVLVLVDVELRSYREAAERLGIPIGTVMSRLHRARCALRRVLATGPVLAGAACCA